MMVKKKVYKMSLEEWNQLDTLKFRNTFEDYRYVKLLKILPSGNLKVAERYMVDSGFMKYKVFIAKLYGNSYVADYYWMGDYNSFNNMWIISKEDVDVRRK